MAEANATGGGSGSASTARCSVLDHRYGSGRPLTLGVEEEYMLCDAETLELSQGIEDLLVAIEGESWAGRVMPELFASTAEVATGVCDTIDDARRDLEGIRRGVAAYLGPLGLRLASAGTHPYSKSEEQRVTPRERYRALIEQLQYVARRELVFGMHIHVGVPDPESAIHVLEGVLIELPVLLALSVNSPSWRGRASGLMSTRTAVFAGFPRSGLPPRFESYEDYAETVSWMEQTGAIDDYTHLWWDVRPHPRLGTIELRVPDVQFDLDYTLALAAYVQALVASLLDEISQGRPPVPYHRQLVAENKWLAARHGLDAPLLDLATGKRTRVTAGQLARRRLRQLKPYARELGCWDALGGIEKILSNGTGATRQIRVFNANQDLHEMFYELCGVTELRSETGR